MVDSTSNNTSAQRHSHYRGQHIQKQVDLLVVQQMSFYMTCIIILRSHLIKLKTFYTFCSRRQTRLLQFNSFFIICCLRWRTLLSVDDMMENVVNILQKKNLLDNTYIVFSSDNGFHLGEFFWLVGFFLFDCFFKNFSTNMTHGISI